PWRWLECLAITALPPLAGIWLRPADPLFTGAAFPWPVLAPLLLGLRHGFALGLSSGLLLGLMLLACHRLALTAAPPGTLALGLLLVGLLAGEFADSWERRLR